jgi:hypothetical protein
MVRKNKTMKRRGGMIRAFVKPLGKATLALGESVGKDYLQNKSAKVVQGIYNDKSLATNPGFIMTGQKPLSKPNIKIYDKENMYNSENIHPNINSNVNSNIFDNFGGRTKRKYKRRKTRKNRK